jgi:hypothetical protein
VAMPRPASSLNGSAKKLPAEGPELHRRLLEADTELAGTVSFRSMPS